MKEIACQDTVTVVLIFVAPLRNIKLSSDSSQPCVRKLQVSPPTIANSFTLLGDLKVGRCSTTAKQRLCKEGFVNANRLSICRERFTKGSVYTMSGFDFTRNFRLSDAPSPYVSLMALF
ncbi:hypothetical protein Bca52824_089037 [Brassica carinata]|uniref:Uncharacterized protein n=1 Tax=Brassica carinata TaxID=52824 RepID=A0A8X7PBC7_BRACI|nr:hypothetical protein Bca52824_089037 [Brassica carinata]